MSVPSVGENGIMSGREEGSYDARNGLLAMTCACDSLRTGSHVQYPSPGSLFYS